MRIWPLRFFTRSQVKLVGGALLAVVTSVASDCFASFVVQVGAYGSAASADEQVNAISRTGLPTIVEKIDRPGEPGLTTVLVGPYENARDAESARTALDGSGIDGFVRFYPIQGNRAEAANGSAAKLVLRPANAAVPVVAAELPVTQDPEPSGLWFRRLAAAAAPSNPDSPAVPQAKAGSFELPFSYSGHFQTAAAYTVASPDHWSKIKNTLHLAVERALSTDINLKISGRFSYDGAYDVSNFYPDRVRRDQRFDGMFHETYLDVGLGDWNLRLGRQNIIWGEVVGLFFADVVTAKDLREFLIPEFDYIRIPQWAARTEYFNGDFKAEALWIPYMTYDRIGKPGSEFYPLVSPPPPGFALNIRHERTPHSLRDSSFGLRTSYLTHGWDLAAFYYGSVDANPTFFTSSSLAPTPTVTVRPDHKRIHQAGFTASKDTGSFILKGEAIYTWDRFFNVTRASDADGNVRQDFLDYILSAEIPLPYESRVNLQFFQRIFTNHDSDIVPRRVENGASFFASTKLFNDKVEPEFLTIHSLNRLDWMTRLKVGWMFAQNWRAVVGTAFFGGKKLGLFGRFDNRDRVFAELRYSF